MPAIITSTKALLWLPRGERTLTSDTERRVPVQDDGPWELSSTHPHRRQWSQRRGREPIPPGTVAWTEHAEAWDEYARRGHGSQSAERIVARGGYSFLELVDLLGREPSTWRPR